MRDLNAGALPARRRDHRSGLGAKMPDESAAEFVEAICADF